MTRRRMALVLVVALLARLIMLGWAHGGRELAPRHGMSARNFASGYGIAAGHGYVTGDDTVLRALQELSVRAGAGGPRLTSLNAPPFPEGDARPEMLHPPGLPLLVAAAHRLFGGSADLPIEILGLLLDSVAVVLAAWAAAAVIGPWTGFLTGLACAMFPPIAYWSTVSKSADGLLGPFVVASLCAALKAARSSGRATVVWHVLSGVAIGLGSWIRPDYLLMPVAVGIAIGVAVRRPATGLMAIALAQAAALVVILPWAARNHHDSGRWIFTSTSVGATLISGLGEFGNPWGFGPLDSDRFREAAAAGFPDPWTPEADAHFRSVFFRSVAERPISWAKTVVLRLPLALATPLTWGYDNPRKVETFTAAHDARGEDRYTAVRRRPSYILAAYWDRLLMSVIVALGTAGSVVLVWREFARRPEVLLLLAPHVYGLGSHLLTHLEPRYLLPSAFCWLVGLAYLIGRGWRKSPEPAGT